MMQVIKGLWQKFYSKWFVLLFDGLSVPLSWCLAYWFRLNLSVVSREIVTSEWYGALIILFAIQISCFYYFKVYRGLWRFFSVSDVFRILKAVLSCILVVLPILHITNLLPAVPRSVLPLYTIILIALMCGARLIYRAWVDSREPFIKALEPLQILIVGAGQAGAGLARDLKRSRQYFPVGFVDDDKSKKGVEVHGIRVLGNTDELVKIAQVNEIDLIFIAVPSASSEQMMKIVQFCSESKISFRTLPSLQDLANGQIQVNALREVHIDDLLGRDQVHLNWQGIRQTVENKKILVTGGGGSIGSELCRQIAACEPESLCVLDNSEYNLYSIEKELKKKFPSLTIQLALVNIEDKVSIQVVFADFKPDIVFHAAAFKHVPMLENQVRIAVMNNIIGTQNVAQASLKTKVSKFILISTDKAVNPTSVMGLTKRIAEMYCQGLNQTTQTQFITVRFGNVLGSKGSVIPLFQEQLKEGGPLTVTHPEIERYFMTIAEACQLILQAMENGEGGEIFVLDMGEPVKISFLAEQVIRLSGKEPGQDIQIEFTGLRPGEKLYEELFHEREQLEKTSHTKLLKARVRPLNWFEFCQSLSRLDRLCEQFDEEQLASLLQSIVPEYRGLASNQMDRACL